MKILILSILLTSCVTPVHWSSEDHRETMVSCRAMCGKNRVRSYEPITAECTCINNK
jgi:hypothetical protein